MAKEDSSHCNPGESQSEKDFYNECRANWSANMKKLFDTFTDIADKQARNQTTLFEKVFTDAQQYDNQRQNIANQALQNAVESANMVGKNALETANLTAKQAVRHSDLAIDRQWNIDEQAAVFAKVIENLSKAGWEVTPPKP